MASHVAARCAGQIIARVGAGRAVEAHAHRVAASSKGFASLAATSSRVSTTHFTSPSVQQERRAGGGLQRDALVSGGGALHRAVHTTAPAHSSVLIGGLSVAAAALAASYAVRAINAANPPDGGEKTDGAAGAAEQVTGGKGGEEAKAAPATHKGFGAEMFARRFYRGPFEDKMTKREAALILGVRESASVERIRDRYKKMLILNHPDMGGSTFLAGKINEAKDILLGKAR